MPDNFFNKEEQQDNADEPQKIKVGEREFTQEELNKRIGLSDIAMEAEEKYNRPISKFWPEYTKANQENEKLRMELEEARKPKAEPTKEELSEEQLKEKVKTEMSRFGYVPADEVRAIANEVISGYKLLDKVDGIVNKFATDGYPKETKEGLLEYMNENNISNPEIAYKMKFEAEIDKVKEEKLKSIKPGGMVTDTRSTAGAKQPAPVKITPANLQSALAAALRG